MAPEYCVAGTSPEGVDVRDYVDVGVTNMAVATGLVLKDGLTYYVTVRGEWSVVCNKQVHDSNLCQPVNSSS